MESKDEKIREEDEFRAVIHDGVLYRVEQDYYGADVYYVRVGPVDQ